MPEDLLVDFPSEHVLRARLNRPAKRNAVSRSMAMALAEAVRRARDDAGIRVAVLVSSGEETFCAGADLNEVAAGHSGIDLIVFVPDLLFGVVVWDCDVDVKYAVIATREVVLPAILVA